MDAQQGGRVVRIAVVGDEGCGKTSLITAAATETFPDRPPPVLPPAQLPADTTPEGVPVVITDTSSRPEDKQGLERACQDASVVVLCFSMENPATLRRVPTYWMPELRRMGITAPVVLVGCKSDIRPADQTLHQARRSVQCRATCPRQPPPAQPPRHACAPTHTCARARTHTPRHLSLERRRCFQSSRPSPRWRPAWSAAPRSCSSSARSSTMPSRQWCTPWRPCTTQRRTRCARCAARRSNESSCSATETR
jgi:GTPase SAR1 family protein